MLSLPPLILLWGSRLHRTVAARSGSHRIAPRGEQLVEPPTPYWVRRGSHMQLRIAEQNEFAGRLGLSTYDPGRSLTIRPTHGAPALAADLDITVRGATVLQGDYHDLAKRRLGGAQAQVVVAVGRPRVHGGVVEAAATVDAVGGAGDPLPNRLMANHDRRRASVSPWLRCAATERGQSASRSSSNTPCSNCH